MRNRPRRPAGRSWSPHERLFLSNGYGATSIRAIADEAGVAVQTVYAVFGNKRQLVIELVENAVTGDDDLAAVTERPETQAIRAEPDPRRRAQLGAALSRKIIERVLPVFKITSDAAAVDPDFAELNQAMIARRRAEMADGATLLAGHDGLRRQPRRRSRQPACAVQPPRRPAPHRAPRLVLRPLPDVARRCHRTTHPQRLSADTATDTDESV